MSQRLLEAYIHLGLQLARGGPAAALLQRALSLLNSAAWLAAGHQQSSVVVLQSGLSETWQELEVSHTVPMPLFSWQGWRWHRLDEMRLHVGVGRNVNNSGDSPLRSECCHGAVLSGSRWKPCGQDMSSEGQGPRAKVISR